MGQGLHTPVSEAEPDQPVVAVTSEPSALAQLLRRLDDSRVQDMLSIASLCALCVLVKVLWLTDVDIYWDAGTKWHFARQWSYAARWTRARCALSSIAYTASASTALWNEKRSSLCCTKIPREASARRPTPASMGVLAAPDRSSSACTCSTSSREKKAPSTAQRRAHAESSGGIASSFRAASHCHAVDAGTRLISLVAR